MSPHRQLILSVTMVAVAIATAWIVLFRNHVLTPLIAQPATNNPTFEDISRQFTEQLQEFDTFLEPKNGGTENQKNSTGAGTASTPATTNAPPVSPTPTTP